ncbi:MAG: hypothetical protein R2695_02555 [Acidimicrobiales bacterium]
MLNFMLLTYDKDAHDVSQLRWVMSGAAPVPVSLIETLRGHTASRSIRCTGSRRRAVPGA